MTFSLTLMDGKKGLSKDMIKGGCIEPATTCAVAKENMDDQADEIDAKISLWACAQCTQDNCNPTTEIKTASFGDVVGSFTTNVGDCQTAKSLADDTNAAASFAAAVKQATGTGGQVYATLSTECPRRLVEDRAVPVRQLSAGNVKCDYAMILASDETRTAMKNSLEQNSMGTKLKDALSAQLQSTSYANVSLTVSEITAEERSSMSLSSNRETNKAVPSHADSALLLMLLLHCLAALYKN